MAAYSKWTHYFKIHFFWVCSHKFYVKRTTQAKMATVQSYINIATLVCYLLFLIKLCFGSMFINKNVLWVITVCWHRFHIWIAKIHSLFQICSDWDRLTAVPMLFTVLRWQPVNTTKYRMEICFTNISVRSLLFCLDLDFNIVFVNTTQLLVPLNSQVNLTVSVLSSVDKLSRLRASLSAAKMSNVKLSS